MAKLQIPKPHEPKPLRTSSETGRLLIALEIPHCKCELSKLCMAGKREYPEECPGIKKCKDCPPAMKQGPCKHVKSADHTLSPDEWEALLRDYDMEGYAEPPEPPPDMPILLEDRITLYGLRALQGYACRSPHDTCKVDEVSIKAVKGKREGRDGLVDSCAEHHEAIEDHGQKVTIENWEVIRERYRERYRNKESKV